MKKIKLCQKRKNAKYKYLDAIVDYEDFEWLNQWDWTASKDLNTFYSKRYLERRSIYMHRVIMGVTDPKIQVDHINGDGLDNRKENLRICNQNQNSCNRRKKNKGRYSSKYIGVYLYKPKIKLKNKVKSYEYWRAIIWLKYKAVYLGTFKNEIEAALAYNEAAKKYHKEFATLNKI